MTYNGTMLTKPKSMKDTFGNVFVVTKKCCRLSDTDVFKVALNEKQIPLCQVISCGST